MVNAMTTNKYLIIENNIVTNIVVWDGGNQWTPPANSIQLIKSTTPAIVWVYDENLNTYELKQVVGNGDIGFTWDGFVLMTNQSDPNIM